MLVPQDPEAAERLGLPRQELKNLTMYGVGGPSKAEAAFVDEFKVGDATSRNMRMYVADGADFGAEGEKARLRPVRLEGR